MRLLVIISCLGFLLLATNANDPFVHYTETVDGYAFDMIAITGGQFLMGSPEDDPAGQPDEQPAHSVIVDDFWMAKFEVTWDLYEQWLHFNASRDTFDNTPANLGIDVDGISSASTPYIDMSFGMGKDGYPATSMTQYAAISFCQWLSAKTGHFYRLPTEAEWEYACKMGLTADEDLAHAAWYSENSPKGYQKAGSKSANSLGIHDLQGNVAEWTMDQYRTDFYATSEEDNPWAVPDQLYPRVLRGGSWHDDANGCRCSARKASHPKWKRIDPQLPKSRWWHTSAPFIGIRLVRPAVKPAKETIKQYWLLPIDDYN